MPTPKELQKPTGSPLVIELVAAAGVDVSGWAVSKKGPVEHPASNPAYCYEWAFVEPDRVVVLKLWYDEMVEGGGRIFDDVDPRAWAAIDGRRSTKARATRFEESIAYAFDNQVPVRVIIGEGTKRPARDESEALLRMERCLLDAEPWFVERYDPATGRARITRGSGPKYADQFSLPEGGGTPRRRETTGEAFVRDPRVRLAALLRARGRCESCGASGFRTINGEIYLETHHVKPLFESGEDTERNVVALCATHHREAHYGATRDVVREKLRALLSHHYYPPRA